MLKNGSFISKNNLNNVSNDLAGNNQIMKSQSSTSGVLATYNIFGRSSSRKILPETYNNLELRSENSSSTRKPIILRDSSQTVIKSILESALKPNLSNQDISRAINNFSIHESDKKNIKTHEIYNPKDTSKVTLQAQRSFSNTILDTSLKTSNYAPKPYTTTKPNTSTIPKSNFFQLATPSTVNQTCRRDNTESPKTFERRHGISSITGFTPQAQIYRNQGEQHGPISFQHRKPKDSFKINLQIIESKSNLNSSSGNIQQSEQVKDSPHKSLTSKILEKKEESSDNLIRSRKNSLKLENFQSEVKHQNLVNLANRLDNNRQNYASMNHSKMTTSSIETNQNKSTIEHYKTDDPLNFSSSNFLMNLKNKNKLHGGSICYSMANRDKSRRGNKAFMNIDNFGLKHFMKENGAKTKRDLNDSGCKDDLQFMNRETQDDKLIITSHLSNRSGEGQVAESQALTLQIEKAEREIKRLEQANYSLLGENQSLKMMSSTSAHSHHKKVEINLTNNDVMIQKLKSEHLKDILALKAENHDLVSRNEAQAKQVEILLCQIKTIETEKYNLNSLLGSIEKEKECLNLMVQKIKIEHSMEMDDLEKEHQRIKDKISYSYEQTNSSLMKELDSIKNKLKVLESRSPIRALEKFENSQTDLRIADLSQKIDDFNSQIAKENKLFCNKEMECESLKLEVDKLTDLSEVKNNQIQCLAKDVKYLMERIHELESTSQSLISSVNVYILLF